MGATLKPNYYDLLGVPPDATPEEIRRAYHDSALQWHPDVNRDAEANDRFLLIKQAYEVLSNPITRKSYDQKLLENNEEPVLTEILYSRPHLSILDEPQLLYVLLSFAANPKVVSAPAAPLNVCLVLDKSTSMQGVRMDTVKEAAIELVRQLGPQDQISIVAFSDRAEVLVPSGRRMERSRIETQIKMMRASGGTEILQGLQAGYDEIIRFLTGSYINHLILITDGRTYGDEDQCLQLAERFAAQGIRITGIGIGAEWNDIFLDELTGKTGGASFFISRTSDIRSLLQEKFEALRHVFAERVALNLKISEGANLISIYRIQPEPTVLSGSQLFRLGSIPKDSKLSILMEFSVRKVESESSRVKIAEGELEVSLPFDSLHPYKAAIYLSRLTSNEVGTNIPPRPIFQALSQINLYRMQERARQEAAAGKVQEASVRLQRLATELLNLGEVELAHTAIMEAERIQQTQMLSAEGEKRIKYGTRAFLLPSGAREMDES
ncbi:MAG: VWA domain-containing protein [Anaerolineales bacterium]|jgi:Ca-activated chloride channel family protein|nr:VWA domain-containing protein [Anaerolineales bacterium]